MASAPRPVGRPKHFENSDELLFYFDEYLDECKEKEEYPNLAGFARKCYCDKWTLLNYKEENHPYSNAMKLIYTFLENATINNKMSDNFKKFYMTNTFKEYKERQELVTEHKPTSESFTEDQEQRLQELINKLNNK